MKIPRFPRQPLPGLFLFAAPGIFVSDHLSTGVHAPLITLILLLVFGLAAIRLRWTVAILLFTACAFFLLHEYRMQENPGRELADAFPNDPLVQATGVVISTPIIKQSSRGTAGSEFRLQLESVEVNNATRRADAVVMVKWVGDSPVYGDRISVMGELAGIPPARNPGQFDYAAYMKRLGIYSQISMLDPTSGEILDGGHGNPIMAISLKARRWIQQKLALDLENSPDTTGLIQGLTLGLKSETSEEVKLLFQRTGTLHLFVVNGLHIGMFMGILFLFVRLLGAGRATSIIIVIPLVCFYALLTGSSTGSIRATVMAIILLSSKLLDGRPAMLNNLAAAGLVILSWDTNELFMPGFQFSFGVVFSIIVLSDWLQQFFGKFGTPDAFLPRGLWSPFQENTYFTWRHISTLLSVSIAASVGSLPFAAGYFNLVTPSSVLANMAVVPLAFLILMEGILSTFFGLISNFFPVLFNNVNWALTHLILWTVHLFAQIPGGHFYVETPSGKPKPPCEITILDLGAASAIHLRTAGEDWLIDCGSGMEYETIVRNYLHSRGVNRLDGFIVTHGSSKFMGAVTSVETDFQPRMSADSVLDDRSPARRKFHEWLADNHAARTEYKSGDLLEIHATQIHVLYPPPDSNARLADDKALVLRLDRYGCSVLFMSSNGPLTERWLLENKPGELRADIIVTNAHGADTFNTPGFLEAVQPKAIVCSAADFPASARIDETWAGNIVARGIALFRQDKTGAVSIGLGIPGGEDGDFTVKAFLGNQSYHGTGHRAK